MYSRWLNLKTSLFALLLCLCAVSLAQEGSNLLDNNDFSECIDGQLSFWSPSPEPFVFYFPEGGPNNGAYLSFRDGGDPKYESKARLRQLTLVPGGTYRISAMVRTADFHAKNGSILVTNSGWFKDEGIRNIPSDTHGAWQKLETTFTCPDSSKLDDYAFVVLTIGQTGVLDVTDVELVPLSGDAIADSRPTLIERLQYRTRLLPWTPCFNEVPLKRPVISFVWFGAPAADFKAEEHLLQATVADASFTSDAKAFEVGVPVEFTLTGVPAGLQTVTLRATNKATGAAVYEESFLVNLRDIPLPEEATQGTRLNNFAVELVGRDVAAGEKVTFSLAHDSWMYFAMADGSAMTLDGKTLSDSITGLPEAFRHVEAGHHVLTAEKGGMMFARTITELFTCAILEGPRLPIFPAYDWEFAKKWAFPALTTLNRGNPSPELIQKAHDSGRIWTSNLNAVTPNSVKEMLQRMDKSLPKSFATFDGVTADELFYPYTQIDNYTQALKIHPYDREKLIYTWVTNAPSFRSMHTDFIATSLNASHGRGKILYEAYMGANDLTEDAARKFLEERLVGDFRPATEFYPDYASRAGIILGNFNQLSVITLEHYPQLDYKYYLDMQLNLLANHPVFEGLGIIGYWGTHYSDEEMYRWSHALLRHYVVEGRREMLSEKYGFSFCPGHIVNNDFEDGLTGWTVQAAAPGSVSTGTFAGYHDLNQNRWGGVPQGCGDSLCLLHAVSGKPNMVSQTAKNLVPGKQYMLLFNVGDYDDLKAQRLRPRHLGFEASLEGAEINDSQLFVDERVEGNYKRNSGIARQNLHRIIFTPTQPEVKITFTDATAKAGETLFFNYVQVKPFYPLTETFDR